MNGTTDISSITLITEVLHEEQQWNEITYLFLDNNAGEKMNQQSLLNMEKLSTVWKGLRPDQIKELWADWKQFFPGENKEVDKNELLTILVLFVENNLQKEKDLLKKTEEVDVDDVASKIINAALWVQKKYVTENPLLKVEYKKKPKSYELQEMPLTKPNESSFKEDSSNTNRYVTEDIEYTNEIDPKRKRSPDETVLLTYTGTARQSTENVKNWTQKATTGFKNAAANTIHNVAKHWEENKIGEKIIPDEKAREVCANVGKVGLAGIGATAIVTESLVLGTFAGKSSKIYYFRIISCSA